MAKGFANYVDGMAPPQKIHINVNSAWREMVRLAELFPDKDVYIYQVVKRMKWDAETKKIVSHGSHIPSDCVGSTIDKEAMVTRKSLKADKVA